MQQHISRIDKESTRTTEICKFPQLILPYLLKSKTNTITYKKLSGLSWNTTKIVPKHKKDPHKIN